MKNRIWLITLMSVIQSFCWVLLEVNRNTSYHTISKGVSLAQTFENTHFLETSQKVAVPRPAIRIVNNLYDGL